MSAVAGRARASILRHWDIGLVVVVCVVGAVLIPLLNVLPSEKSVFHVPDFFVALIGKLTCYAIVAVAMDFVWGYAGILSLCHGLFFALGGWDAAASLSPIALLLQQSAGVLRRFVHQETHLRPGRFKVRLNSVAFELF